MDAIDILLLDEIESQILENFVDFLEEKEQKTLSPPYTTIQPFSFNSITTTTTTNNNINNNNNNYSPMFDSFQPPSFSSSSSPSSVSSCNSFLSPPPSASPPFNAWDLECPPSTSSDSSSSSSFSYPSQRSKRGGRRLRQSSTSTKSPTTSTRGRGRPMKDNTDGDRTMIRKRIYAREYRQKNQKVHDELFTFALDLYKSATAHNMDIAKLLPQHKKIILQIMKAL